MPNRVLVVAAVAAACTLALPGCGPHQRIGMTKEQRRAYLERRMAEDPEYAAEVRRIEALYRDTGQYPAYPN